MTTATRVTIHPINPNPEALEAITDGLRDALQAMDSRQWDFAYDKLTGDEIEPEAVAAFALIVSDVAAEIAPSVLQLAADAMNRRLPWTWEPER